MKIKILLFGLILIGLAISCDHTESPKDKRPPVVDEYHGVQVTDDYRWLENWNDPTVQAWSEAQNQRAREYLQKLPHFDEIKSRITELYTKEEVTYGRVTWNNGRFFALKYIPGRQQPLLVGLESLDSTDDDRTILDLLALDPAGSYSIDWFVPSLTGKYMAISLSRFGSEDGDVHIYDLETGNELTAEIIPHVNGGTAGGGLAWDVNDAGFYYTRYPREGERPEEDRAFYQQIYYHQLGTGSAADRYELGQGFPKIAASRMEVDENSRLVLATVQKGDSGLFSFHLRRNDGVWQQMTDFDDPIVQGFFGPDSTLYFISLKDAPRGKIIRLPLSEAPDMTRARVIVEQSAAAIVTDFYGAPTVITTDNFIYARYQLGGPSTIRSFEFDGTPVESPALLPVSSVYTLVPLAGDQILYSNASYLEPTGYYIYDPATKLSTRASISKTNPLDVSALEIKRVSATSKDGTQIPLNIIQTKGIALDGSHPVLLSGYGGFNVSIAPGFSLLDFIWIEQGGIVAEANLRGGGEFGAEWHEQGRLTHKQNVYDDFTACLDYLVENQYTTPEKLVITGGSNGGLLMGAILTQHPEKFAATVSTVGIYDMLRNELTPNGTFNIPEYGTVANPDHFQAMYAYSPYHRVKEGTDYPAVLFMTGANDPRVDPMHSRKMTARLQAATSSDRPILLRTSARTGHGGGTPFNEKVDQKTCSFAFLFHFAGVDFDAERKFDR